MTKEPLDRDTLDALAALLSSPDPADLPRRSHVLRYPGILEARAWWWRQLGLHEQEHAQ